MSVCVTHNYYTYLSSADSDVVTNGFGVTQITPYPVIPSPELSVILFKNQCHVLKISLIDFPLTISLDNTR